MQLRRTKTEKIQQPEKLIILFSVGNSIAKLIFYALSWLKLSFGYYVTFEITYYALKPENSAFLIAELTLNNRIASYL